MEALAAWFKLPAGDVIKRPRASPWRLIPVGHLYMVVRVQGASELQDHSSSGSNRARLALAVMGDLGVRRGTRLEDP